MQPPDERGTLLAMRLAGTVVVLMAMSLLAGASAVSADNGDVTCPPSTEIPSGVLPKPLVCKAGKAVVRTARGVSNVLTPSACFIGVSGARLYFGQYPWDTAPERPSTLYLVVERERGDHSRAAVIDGGMHLRRGMHLPVIGTARLRDGLRSGTFTIFSHLGNGVKGKSKFSGHWTCGTPPATRH